MLVENGAELGPHLSATTAPFSSCSRTPSAPFSVQPGPQGGKFALFSNIRLSFSQEQRAGVQPQKGKVLCILVKRPAPMLQTSQHGIRD